MPSAVESHANRGLVGSAVRVAVLASLVFAATCFVALRAVRADLEELLSKAGDIMMSYPGAHHEDTRRLRFNGVDVSFRTQVVDERFEDVFEHYRALCDLRAIATSAHRDEDTGYVACLDAGDRPRGIDAVVDRLRKFSQTGNLGILGDLRYVFARAAGSLDEDKTFLLTAWSDSDVELTAVLPRFHEDAAGRDPIGVPRPARTQRVLSAFELGGPSGVFVYRYRPRTAGEVSAFYRRRLTKSGWAILERHPGESLRLDEVEMIAAEKERRLVTVVLQQDESADAILIILTSEQV